MRPSILLTAAALAAATTIAAAPGDGDVDGYVECTGLSPSLGNVQTANLVTTPPSTSVTAGHGCGAPDAISFAGELEAGVVDAATIRLDWLGAGAERGGQDLDVTGTLTIDDVAIDFAVTVTPVPTNDAGAGPVTHDVEFTLTDLAAQLPESSGTRSVSVIVRPPGTNGAPYAGPGLWVWGTTEVPAGITLHAVAP